MRVTLTVSDGMTRTVVVDSPEFLIGRATDCDLKLQNPMVSRHHCVLTIQDDHLFVRDLRSSNGTGINSHILVGERLLHDRDRLWIAVTPIEVRIQHSRARWLEQALQTLQQRLASHNPKSAHSSESAAPGLTCPPVTRS
jgi:pSer/pThr/pTyr-binding forkhead associated (FHA) protein